VEVSRAAREALEAQIAQAAGERRFANAKTVASIMADILGIAERIETRSVQPPLERS
jgi:hypothetical protein